METNQLNDNIQKDVFLWKTAKRRTKFKSSLVSYVLVNAFLIGIWSLGEKDNFWPIWILLAWGMGLTIKYFKIYHFGEIFSTEKEYRKLTDYSNQ